MLQLHKTAFGVLSTAQMATGFRAVFVAATLRKTLLLLMGLAPRVPVGKGNSAWPHRAVLLMLRTAMGLVAIASEPNSQFEMAPALRALATCRPTAATLCVCPGSHPSTRASAATICPAYRQSWIAPAQSAVVISRKTVRWQHVLLDTVHTATDTVAVICLMWRPCRTTAAHRALDLCLLSVMLPRVLTAGYLGRTLMEVVHRAARCSISFRRY